jgi:hypothetical protein
MIPTLPEKAEVGFFISALFTPFKLFNRMIKVKIKSCRIRENTGKAPQKLNRIAQANLDFLLNNEFPVSRPGDKQGIADNFVEDMLNQEFERTGNFDIYDNDENIPKEQDVMRELVQSIAPLSTNKIVKAITGKSYGKIFKLDNDHILKIFLGGVDVDSDMAWFKKCYEDLHSGKAKQTTLPVYAFNYGNLLSSYPDYKIGYVEMAEVEPLDSFMKSTGRGDADNVLMQLKALFELALGEGIKDVKSLKAYVSELVADSSQIEPLTKNEVYGILYAFLDMVKMGFKLSDVAPRNLGVLKQSNPSNPKIIIFDR